MITRLFNPFECMLHYHAGSLTR